MDIGDFFLEVIATNGDHSNHRWHCRWIDQDLAWGISWLGTPLPTLSKLILFLFCHIR
jgi:hypothetical protein